MANAKRQREVQPGAVKKSSTVLVANQHTGGIVFPRKGQGGVHVPPLRLPPGSVTPVDREEWEARKKSPVVQYYLDNGLLAEVNRVGPVPVLDSTTSHPEVPEHLQDEEHEGKQILAEAAPATARVRQKKRATITI